MPGIIFYPLTLSQLALYLTRYLSPVIQSIVVRIPATDNSQYYILAIADNGVTKHRKARTANTALLVDANGG